jgi:hypothetical protein
MNHNLTKKKQLTTLHNKWGVFYLILLMIYTTIKKNNINEEKGIFAEIPQRNITNRNGS